MNETKKIELLEKEINNLSNIIIEKDSQIERLKTKEHNSFELNEFEHQKFQLLEDTIQKYNEKIEELKKQLDSCRKLEEEYFNLILILKDIQKDIQK